MESSSDKSLDTNLKLGTNIVVPETPSEVVIATTDAQTRKFKWFKMPKEPKGLITRKDSIRKVTLKDGSVVHRVRKGHIQANILEIERCANAVKSREAAIAKAEDALTRASTPLEIEKAKERLEVCKIRRDHTVKRLEMLIAYAKEHNVATIEKRMQKDEDGKIIIPENASVKALKVIESRDRIKHLDKVKGDILLTAQIKAGGSRKNSAFEKLRDQYSWIVSKFTRTGATPLETDDAVSKGIQGLWDAAVRFDATRSRAVFSTVAYNWVRRNTRVRTKADVKPGQFMVNGETKYHISIDGQVNDDDENTEFSFASSQPTEDSDSLKSDVAEAMASLAAHHQEILRLRHFENMSYADIATTLSLPVNMVRQLTSEAHGMLQKKLLAYFGG